MNSRLKRVNVAVVGAGYFSRFHVDAWRRIENVNLLAIVDSNPTAAQWADLPVYSTLEQMLAKEKPDIVDIATPPSTHLPMITEVLASSASAIICQKPFCGDLGKATAAVERAKTADKPLVVHENFRFQPWYRFIREQIYRGDCGDIKQLTFRLRTGDGQGERAYLDRQPYFQTMPKLLIHETGVHWVDTFRYLLGEPISVYADLRRLNPVIAGEDAGHFLFEFDNGARALFDGNRLLDSGVADNRITLGNATVEGLSASLTLNGDGSVYKRQFGETESQCVLPARNYPGFAGDCVFHCQASFISAFLGEGDFENTGGDYLQNLQWVNAIYRSAETGTKISL